MPAADPLTFRTAGEPDLENVLDIVQSGYRGDESRAGWTTEADLLDGQRADLAMLHDVIANENERLVLVEQSGSPVATFKVARENAHTTSFGLFAVRPHAQGGGIGRAAMAEGERIARDELDATVMRLYVIDVRAELIAWYERLGYKATGDTEPFPYGEERFGIPTRPDLRFAVFEKAL